MKEVGTIKKKKKKTSWVKKKDCPVGGYKNKAYFCIQSSENARKKVGKGGPAEIYGGDWIVERIKGRSRTESRGGGNSAKKGKLKDQIRRKKI